MDNTRDNLSIAVSAGKNKKLKYVKQVYGQIVIGPPGKISFVSLFRNFQLLFTLRLGQINVLPKNVQFT